jgi:negative regulator of sigma E activity
MPEGMWVFLPFAKRAIRQAGTGLPSWRDLWGFRSDKLDLAQRNYDLRFVGREKVADLPCLVVELVPKFKENPKRRLWIHPPTRLPLRMERYDPDGALRVRIAFTEVQIDRPLPLLIFDTTLPQGWQLTEVSAQRQPINVAEAMRVLGFALLLPTWVPPGYVLDGVFALQDRQWKVAHIVYTDGISVISLFEHPAPKERPREGDQPRSEKEAPHPRMGPPPMVRMFPQQWVRRNIGGLRIVLVGEASREWLERIAESLASQIASDR